MLYSVKAKLEAENKFQSNLECAIWILVFYLSKTSYRQEMNMREEKEF